MREHAVEDITERPDEKQSANAAYRVLYDGQCEVCQSCVSWLRNLCSRSYKWDHLTQTAILELPTSSEGGDTLMGPSQLCDLIHFSVRVGPYLRRRGALAIQSLRLPPPSRGYRSLNVGSTAFDE